MGIFSGEKYSKVAYEGAERTSKDTGSRLDQFREQAGEKVWTSGDLEVNELLLTQAVEAIESKRKLYKKSQGEATTLNDKYDHLLAQAQEALKAVEHFEKEELGMSKETVH